MKAYFKRYISSFLIGLLMFHSSAQVTRAQDAIPFDDISNSYAMKQIIDLSNQRLIDGVSNRIFAPDRAINRAEFTTLLLRVLQLQPVDNAISAFADVPRASWFYGYVHAGMNLGMVDGTSPGTFDPSKAISRQEAAALLVRATKQETLSTDSIALPFDDASKVSSWAIPYVDAANRLGLMQGNMGQFRPEDELTREEAVVIFDRILHMSGWSAEQSSSPRNGIQLGWQYNQTTDQFIQRIKQTPINTLSPRWIFLNEGNQFTVSVDQSLVSWAHQNEKKVWALVGNRFNTELTHQLLSQPEARASAVKQLVDVAQKYQLDGLNMDFESLDPTDRAAYSTFINDLSQQLHAKNIILSVCVPPDLEGDWSAPFDYALLGKSADYLVLMGYEEHWPGAPEPGSVSSMPWLEKAMNKLTSAVLPNKVIVGLPLYSREWSTTGGKTSSRDLDFREQNQIVNAGGSYPTWDSTVGQYIYSSNKAEGMKQIWVEDMRSLALKYRQAEGKSVAGFAYWYIGSESNEIWTGLNNERKYAGYNFGSSK